jgi:hypothetical protein
MEIQESTFALHVSLKLKIPITFIETIYRGSVPLYGDTYYEESKVQIGVGIHPDTAKDALLEEYWDERGNMIFPRTKQELPQMAEALRGCELEIVNAELVRPPSADSQQAK